MIRHGFPTLIPSRTNAAENVWAEAIYPAPERKTIGICVADVLRGLQGSAVVVVDTWAGRVVGSSNATTAAALLALLPADGVAVCAPPTRQSGTMLQWSLTADPWSFAGGQLSTIVLPQLSKRSVASFIDKAVSLSSGYPFALVNQAAVTVQLWETWDATASDALALVVGEDPTIALSLRNYPAEYLPFEGGPV
jgi:hypothetical protein